MLPMYIRGSERSRVWCAENRCPRAQPDRETSRNRKRTGPVRVRQDEFSGWLVRRESSREHHRRETVVIQLGGSWRGGVSCQRHHLRARVLPAAGPVLAARARHVEVDFGTGSTSSSSCSRTKRLGEMLAANLDHRRIPDLLHGHPLDHLPGPAIRRSRKVSNDW